MGLQVDVGMGWGGSSGGSVGSGGGGNGGMCGICCIYINIYTLIEYIIN